MTAKIVSGKGVNKDLLPSELAPGVWSDCLNFRTRNGVEEKFEGVVVKTTAATITDTDGALMYNYTGGSVSGVAVYLNSTKAYYVDSSLLHQDITRYRKSESIASLTRIGANTAQVKTSSAHGLATFDYITLYGATESGHTVTGYNATEVIITVIDATTFQYATASAITNDALNRGAYVVVVSSATSDFTSLPTTGGVLNSLFFIYATFDGGLHYWNGGLFGRLTRAPLATNFSVQAARPFKNYVVILGLRTVHWSDSAEPGAFPTTFDASTTNDAGDVLLAETTGYLVDCLPLGDVNIIYKQDSRYSMQYVGGEEVFRFSRLPGNDGLYKTWCVVNTPKGHVFITKNLDIKIHSGGEAVSIAEGRMRKYFASQFDIVGHSDRIFLVVNPEKSEVWVCFATSSSTKGCDKAIVWNWVDDTWGIFSLGSPVSTGTNGISFAASGVWTAALSTKESLLVADSSFGIKAVDSSATSGLTGTLERTGMDFQDADTLKNLQRSRWNFDGTAADTATIYHGSSMTADGTTSWTAGTPYTIGATDFANARATGGRFVGVKLSTTANSLALRSFDLDITPGGKR